jgi:hypothetical protein
MAALAGLVLVCLAAAPFAVAQQIDFPKAHDDASIQVVAQQLIATYANDDRDQYLDNLMRFQLVAGRYADAKKTLHAMRPSMANIRWEIYANARLIEAAEKKPFADSFRQSFRETFGKLDEDSAYRVLWSLGTLPSVLQDALRQTLDRHKGAASLPISDAVDLVRKYLSAEAYRSFAPVIAAVRRGQSSPLHHRERHPGQNA